jgi:hypothetical protein
MRIFMKDFTDISIPLTRLLQKDAPFQFLEEEIAAQDVPKLLLINSPALWQIDYASGRRCIMDVNTSFRGAGYVLLQLGEDGKEYPPRFGSTTWNERESCYSQAKLKLYDLFRALKAY